MSGQSKSLRKRVLLILCSAWLIFLLVYIYGFMQSLERNQLRVALNDFEAKLIPLLSDLNRSELVASEFFDRYIRQSDRLKGSSDPGAKEALDDIFQKYQEAQIREHKDLQSIETLLATAEVAKGLKHSLDTLNENFQSIKNLSFLLEGERKDLIALVSSDQNLTSELSVANQHKDSLKEGIEGLVSGNRADFKQIRLDLTDADRNQAWLQMALVVILALASIFAVAWILTKVVRNLHQATRATEAFAQGNFSQQFDTSGDDESGQLLRSLAEFRDKQLLPLLDERNQALRIKQALDASTVNMMIADAENNIVHMNKSVIRMLKNAEADLKRDLPDFDSATLLGRNMDVFHKKPEHQRSLLAKLTKPYQAEIKVGGRTFRLTASPIISSEQVRIGTSVEWLDRTQEVLIEEQIGNLITQAARGDLSQRIDLEGKNGFVRNLAEGLNELVQIADEVVQDTLKVFSALAKGDLSARIEAEYQGAFGILKRDANQSCAQIAEVMQKIRDTISSLNQGANEIAQGSTDLSQRTEEQASSLEQTASSMEQMTSAVRQSRDNAEEANQLSSQARERAQQGGQVVSRAVVAMEEINHSSKRIADIITVIDEIAFQTNLLALNASVEAARAGEQGRGFAVVAGEVRNLAQRSAAAAKEIKGLIRDSVSKVDTGSQLVNESGQTLALIVEAVEEVGRMINAISQATREQANGIEQVNQAIAQMDQMTQQNAALVEESSAAAENLATQSRDLSKMVAFFRTGQESPMVSRAGGATAKVSLKPVAKQEIKHSQPVLESKPDEDWDEF